MSRRFRLAVDAGNLVRDRRGMGRLARSVLHEASRDAAFDVVLLAAKRSDRLALRTEFEGTGFAVAGTGEASRRGRFDAVWYPFNGVRFRAAAPSLVLIHDVFAFTEPHPGRVARHREQAPIRRAAREATAFVTTTAWNRTEIARELALAPDRIEIIPPGPAPLFTPGDVVPPAGVLAGKTFVLAVGGGEPRKNLAMLVDACAAALARPAECLAVVGSLPSELAALAAARGLTVVSLAADDEALRALYRGAAVVAVPSRAEGFGLVAVEAMACGAPVVAGDGSGLREAVGGGARLVAPDDTAAWSAVLRELLDDPALRAGLAARGLAAVAAIDRHAHARRTLAALRALGDAAAGSSALGGSGR